ncbi:MAG: glycoside hydrolase family 95 protein, partial [Opitutaceae bacterium]|nr:glycoside hydrolase family 95 protein [Opitutaceae bacterium]
MIPARLPAALLAIMFFAPVAAIPASAAASATTPDESLWYDKPASKWVEALPVGNGRVAAMIHGGIAREHIQFNEDTLVSGEPPPDLRSLDIRPSRERVFAMIRDGKHAEADRFIMKNWLGRGQPCYQPFGDIHIDFDGADSPRPAPAAYRRWLDLRDAIAGVEFVRDGVTYT